MLSKHTELQLCAVGEPHQNWMRKCNQGGLIMDGGLFSSASSLQACAYTLAASSVKERRGQAVNSRENQRMLSEGGIGGTY